MSAMVGLFLVVAGSYIKLVILKNMERHLRLLRYKQPGTPALFSQMGKKYRTTECTEWLRVERDTWRLSSPTYLNRHYHLPVKTQSR